MPDADRESTETPDPEQTMLTFIAFALLAATAAYAFGYHVKALLATRN